MSNVTFADNNVSDDRFGGGLNIASSSVASSIVLNNITFTGNTGGNGAVHIATSGYLEVNTMLVEGNTAVDTNMVKLVGTSGSTVRELTVTDNIQSEDTASGEALVLIGNEIGIEGLYIRDNIVDQAAFSRGFPVPTEHGVCVYVHDNQVVSPAAANSCGLLIEGALPTNETTYGSYAIGKLGDEDSLFTVFETTLNHFSCGNDGYYVGADSNNNHLCACPATPGDLLRVVNGDTFDSIECDCPEGTVLELSYPPICDVSDFSGFVLACSGGDSLANDDDGETGGLNPALILGGILLAGVLVLGFLSLSRQGLSHEGETKPLTDEEKELNRMTGSSGVTMATQASKFSEISTVSEVQERIQRNPDGTVSANSAGRKKKNKSKNK